MEESNINVILLLSDLAEAKKISRSFRKIGVLPSVVSDFSEFCNLIDDYTYQVNLAIVDVKLMSSKSRTLINNPRVNFDKNLFNLNKDHPFFNNPKKLQDCFIHLAFYYDDSSRPLLLSTYDIFSLDVFKKSLSYDLVLKRLMKRYSMFINQNREITSSEIKLNNLQSKSISLIRSEQESKKKSFFENIYNEVVHPILKLEKENNFYDVLEKTLLNLEGVKKFTVYQLSSDKKNLVSWRKSNFASNKFVDFPTLWLGRSSDNGIEHFAKSLISQVVMDQWSYNIKMLNIYSTKNNPEIIICLNVDENWLESFDFSRLEVSLNSIYLKDKVKSDRLEVISSKNLVDQWTFLTFLNENSECIEDEKKILKVDLSHLVNVIQNKKNFHFLWSDFFQVLLNKFDGVMEEEIFLTTLDLSCMLVLVNANDAQRLQFKFKTILDTFSYWRFFDLDESLFTIPISSKVSILSASVQSLFQANLLDSLNSKKEVSYLDIQENKIKSQKLMKKNLRYEI